MFTLLNVYVSSFKLTATLGGTFYNPQSNHLKNCKKRCNENHNIYIEMEYLKNIQITQKKADVRKLVSSTHRTL